MWQPGKIKMVWGVRASQTGQSAATRLCLQYFIATYLTQKRQLQRRYVNICQMEGEFGSQKVQLHLISNNMLAVKLSSAPLGIQCFLMPVASFEECRPDALVTSSGETLPVENPLRQIQLHNWHGFPARYRHLSNASMFTKDGVNAAMMLLALGVTKFVWFFFGLLVQVHISYIKYQIIISVTFFKSVSEVLNAWES